MRYDFSSLSIKSHFCQTQDVMLGQCHARAVSCKALWYPHVAYLQFSVIPGLLVSSGLASGELQPLCFKRRVTAFVFQSETERL